MTRKKCKKCGKSKILTKFYTLTRANGQPALATICKQCWISQTIENRRKVVEKNKNKRIYP